ncbi:MAG TPA: choice-of-anchor R domain-containing protein [Rhizomicrobium sp.]|nr:choice-of-anchor R domain-containing protein [Rhizomicrobium sp.]
MIARIAVGAGLLAFASATVATAGEARAGDGFDAVTVRGPHATMTVLPNAPAQGLVSAKENGKGLVTIFSSLASKYPKGVYWCCEGYNVMGSNSGVGVQWMGGAFTPDVAYTLTEVEVALGYSGQGANGAVIRVTDDNSGAPGKTLKKWSVSGLPVFGTCCTIVVKTDRTGIALTGGKQYWIVASTNSSETDTVDGWNVSDADQVDQATTASWDGTVWHTFQTAPGLAFAVKGAN